jgi:hypothetical protein
MRMRAWVAVWLVVMATLLALLLTACGWQGKGTVVEKTHRDAYSYITMQCSAYTAKGACSVWMPVTNHVPERWGYKVQDSKDGAVHDVTTNQEDWNAHKVGDHYDNTGGK